MKKTLTTLSAAIILGMSIPSLPSVQAETPSLAQTQKALAELNEQIKKVDRAISDNRQMIVQTEEDIKSTQTQLKGLEEDIRIVEKRLEARNEILEGRARSFQENGGELSYLSVLLGAADLQDFVSRVATITTIVQADKELLDEHQKDMKEIDEKKQSISEKLKDLESKKTELLGMQQQIEKQKQSNNALKATLKQQEKDGLAQLAEKQAEKVSAPVEKKTLSGKSPASPKKDVSIPKSNQAVSGSVQTVITAGNKYIGNSVYVFGGGRNASDIANGRFDCSGFVHWAFAQAGVSVGSSTESLKNQGTPVSVSEMRPGDLVFFDTYKKDGHVGIYIGNGRFIGSQSSTGVAIANMTSGYWKQTFNGRVNRIMQ